VRQTKVLNLNQSVLYMKRSHRKLADVLGIVPNEFPVLRGDSLYFVRSIEEKPGKTRVLQTPTHQLRSVHDRIQRFLSQLKMPDYVYSGRKGRSPILNAKEHLGYSDAVKMDIRKFFPSCRREFIEKFFLNDLKMTSDVAVTLSEICTVADAIPTGSPLSMTLAFWAYKPTFDRIEALAKHHRITFTLYVDDMVFSSNSKIPRSFMFAVFRLIRRVKHQVHPDKTKIFTENKIRVITGTAISGYQLLVPNKRRKKILDLMQSGKSLEALSEKEKRSLIGMIQSARQIEPHFFDKTYQILRKIPDGKTLRRDL
jgi:RNA-directed DNA polymerase